MSWADALPELDRLVETTATDHHCPTISWGIVANGHLAHAGSYGTLHNGRAPTRHTVYRMASMTKSFTAAAVLALRDDSIVALDEPIVRYAPELTVGSPDDGAAPIRLRDLLSMSAGLATDDLWADRHLDITDDELDAALARGVLFAGRTGDANEYSNLGYGLIGRVVKRAAGRRVQDVITERFLMPLGMARTTWVRPDHDDWARPYDTRDGNAVADGEPLGDGEIAPMGGLWTTVSDLATWISWMDDAYAAEAADVVLSRASRRELQQMHRYIGMVSFAGRTIGAGYGFGLRVRDDPRIGRVITHSGGVPGYGSTMRWLAGRRFGVIALGNTTYAPMTDMVQAMVDVIADHDGLPSCRVAEEPMVERLARRLITLLNAWDDRSAGELFTDNVALDEPFEHRAAAARRWLEACGGTLTIERFEAHGATSGRVAITHPSGRPLWIDLQLGPLLPHSIQGYDFELETGD